MDNSKNIWISGCGIVVFGRPYRSRTCDTLIKSHDIKLKFNWKVLCSVPPAPAKGIRTLIDQGEGLREGYSSTFWSARSTNPVIPNLLTWNLHYTTINSERRQAVSAFSTGYMGFRWSPVRIRPPRPKSGKTLILDCWWSKSIIVNWGELFSSPY